MFTFYRHIFRCFQYAFIVLSCKSSQASVFICYIGILAVLDQVHHHHPILYAAWFTQGFNKLIPSDSLQTSPLYLRMWFLFEKEANDAAEFFMSLEKEPQQEDFLQGRMLGNPYSSTEPGLGPLMRDVKNKICQG